MYSKDSDSQSSTTKSGKLENRFDKNALQKELNIQVETTKGFVQTASAAGNAIANKLGEEAVAKQREAQAAQEAADRAYKANPSKENETALNTANQNLITANNEADKWQTGGEYKRKIDGAMNAISAALGGLPAGGIVTSALSPEINNQIKLATEGSPMANKVAHAVWGAVEAYSANQNAAAGAGGALAGEATAEIIARAYGKPVSELTANEKENISTLSQLAGGLAAALTAKANGTTTEQGGNFLAVTSGAETAKRAVENNYLFFNEAKEKAILLEKVKTGTATEKDKQRLSQIERVDIERDEKVIAACQNNALSSVCQGEMSLVNKAYWDYFHNSTVTNIYGYQAYNRNNILYPQEANKVADFAGKYDLQRALKEKNIHDIAQAYNLDERSLRRLENWGEVGAGIAAGIAGHKFTMGSKPQVLPKGANANDALPVVGETKGYENQSVSISGGEYRANLYSKNWAEASLSESIEKFAGKNPIITTTDKGKRIYENPITKVQIVEDVNGKYFRIFDPSISGKRKYLDLNGRVPNNKFLENGKQQGRTKAEYNQVTHFKIKE